jgi:hypothetical protein
MIEFTSIPEEESVVYEHKYDRYMYFDADHLQAIQLAARARCATQIEEVGTPYEFDRGVMSLQPTERCLFMNPTYVGLYRSLLQHYAWTGYLTIFEDQGLDMEECRARAENVDVELALADEVYEIIKDTDFDAYPGSIAPNKQISQSGE